MIAHGSLTLTYTDRFLARMPFNGQRLNETFAPYAHTRYSLGPT